MASADQVDLSIPHTPKQHAIEAFEHVQHQIRAAIVASRHDWNKHEPKMWSLASQVSDHDLVNFTIKDDLVLVRAGETAYGPIIFGKIRIRAIKLDSSGNLIPSEVVKDAHGKIQVDMKDGKIDDDHLGFLFVRIHDPPGGGIENITFHSLHTYEGKDKEGNNNGVYRAIQTNSTPFEFFDD